MTTRELYEMAWSLYRAKRSGHLSPAKADAGEVVPWWIIDHVAAFYKLRAQGIGSARCGPASRLP